MKMIFILGCLVGIANCAWMYFPLDKADLFIVSIIFGGVQAVLLVGSLAFTSDLINKNTVSHSPQKCLKSKTNSSNEVWLIIMKYQ